MFKSHSLSTKDKELIYHVVTGNRLNPYSSNGQLDAMMLGHMDSEIDCILYSTIAASNNRRTNYRDANLEDKDLSRRNFTEALFWGANLKNTKVKGAIFYRAKGLTNEQKQYLRDHGALKVPLDIIYEPEEYDKEVFDPSILSYKEKLKRYFTWKFKSKNQGTQRFEEDFEEFLKETSYPNNDLSFNEKIKAFFKRKYKLFFKMKNKETQTEEISIQTD